MTDQKRLIEVAFPLKQASLDSVHEKNVRHGHISTLHIWPARRPLAACRAALIATLLPDPGTPEARKALIEKIGGTVVKKIETKKIGGKTIQVEREETVGGILHWGRESNPDMEWFRREIRNVYGGRAPKVLDPFAGGGAIPLEAMRLGCEVTAIDINPVAWFILKCTLEYPQKLAGQHRPLPKFALESREFMEGFFKGTGKLTKKQLERNLQAVQARMFPPPDVDLSWHVRAWGWWVLNQARKELARFYPVYADFETIQKADNEREEYEPKLVPLKDNGTPDLERLNSEFNRSYLQDLRNPRWIAKPTVAYLWARTVACKNCRAQVPLLKTRWLCKKDNYRVLLTMEPKEDTSGVRFGVAADVPVVGGNPAQRRERDKNLGNGTISRSGATCLLCKAVLSREDVRWAANHVGFGALLTAVVVDGLEHKEYRMPTSEECDLVGQISGASQKAFNNIPFGMPEEALTTDSKSSAWCIGYALDMWYKLFTSRQLLALATFVSHIRETRKVMTATDYPQEWIEALQAYLALTFDRLVDRSSTLCRPDPTPTQSGIINTFSRFALPITWDFIECVPIAGSSGGFAGATEWIAKVTEHLMRFPRVPEPFVLQRSALESIEGNFDVIITDPPYYDAIPYSALMDFFYVWLRRITHGNSGQVDKSFAVALAPKWDYAKGDGELIDDAARWNGDRTRSKSVYEEGMFLSFQNCHRALSRDGRFVIVFAHKEPDAWETLVSAIIHAGFVVDGSWPIQTEMRNRTRALSSAALSSSVWLICRKRSETARPGWDNVILEEMRANIQDRMRDFWDAGIRGPDFVWAATGPALEAYSKHPVVKKANDPGGLMEVPEFLRHVRRIVVDFVVGRVLSHNGDAESISGLDDVTTYYLLHRHDFGMDDAPSGACILYALSCGLSDHDLADHFDVLIRTGGRSAEEEDEEKASDDDSEAAPEEGTGSKVKLKTWQQRRGETLGYEAPGGRPVPLIDQVHRLMHLWRAGDQVRVDEYLDSKALRKNALFHQLLQAIIELAQEGSEERSLLESISNHITARGVEPGRQQPALRELDPK